jgi:hypothetical protein
MLLRRLRGRGHRSSTARSHNRERRLDTAWLLALEDKGGVAIRGVESTALHERSKCVDEPLRRRISIRRIGPKRLDDDLSKSSRESVPFGGILGVTIGRAPVIRFASNTPTE